MFINNFEVQLCKITQTKKCKLMLYLFKTQFLLYLFVLFRLLIFTQVNLKNKTKQKLAIFMSEVLVSTSVSS